MQTRFVFWVLIILLAATQARAEDENPFTPTVYLASASEANHEDPLEKIAPAPKLVPLEPENDDKNTLEESYTEQDPLFPYKFGSKPNERVWGIAGMHFYGYGPGEKEAPNGVRYHPYFSFDLLINVALVQDRSVYLYADTRFWGESNKDHVAQSNYDFSKREYDLTPGIAWNYLDRFEARAFAYSYNNLNRGNSLVTPSGYNDGVGLENRYYFQGTDFDRGIYNFIGFGYYPSKNMVGLDGNLFTPAAFLSFSGNVDIIRKNRLYAYATGELITRRPLVAKLFHLDAGLAGRPFTSYPNLEFRIGGEHNYDLELGVWLPMWYFGVRYAF